MSAALRRSVVVVVVVVVALAAGCPSNDARPPVAQTATPTTTNGSYSCPMHPEVVSDKPGKCPKCAMDLVSTSPQVPITVTVSTTRLPVPGAAQGAAAQPEAGKPVRLVFEMKSADARLTSFDVVHEKKLHLLIVTPDLGWFAHQHPEPQPDGTFVLDYTFPSGGTYRLFADFKAAGRGGTVLPTDIVVEGAPKAPQALTPTDLSAPRTVEGHEVRLATLPPAAGVEKTLTFNVTKDGKPATDLEPYLGAMGHLVIIGSDAKTFLHAHPAEHAAMGGMNDMAGMDGMKGMDMKATKAMTDAKPHVDAAGAAPHKHPSSGTVSFATSFPHAGRYKAWAQFQVNGKPIIADFVFDVAPGSPGAAPASDDHAHQH